MTERDKVTVNDIIGLVDCEPTNSVEEVRKLRGRENRTEKRFTIFGEWHKDCVIDEIRDNTGEYVTIGRVVDLLNENEQLKKDCTVLIHHNQDYRKENEQLKHKLKSLNDNFNHLKRLFDEIEEPISDELLAEYSKIVVEDLND